MELSKDAVFFQSAGGECVLYGSQWGNPLFFSPDGQLFFEVHSNGLNGRVNEHDLSFEDPHKNNKGKLHRKDNEVELNGKIYIKIDNYPTNIEVVPLPTVRQPEYLFGLPNGDYIYVSADKYRYSYESFKLFIGNKEAMTELAIKDVKRYRDGGTTYIETSEGTLYCPTPFECEAFPTWRNTRLEKLDPKEFDIIENNGYARLYERNQMVVDL